MHNEAVDTLKIVEWSGDTHRLIPSRFPPISVYEGLVEPEQFEALMRVEDLTNPRLRSLARIAQKQNEDPATSARLQNWNLAPFAYGNPEGSLFFGEDIPCLEVAVDPQTALAVSVARRQEFLSRTSEAPTGLDMRMLKTPVIGRFLDLSSQIIKSRADCRRIGESISDDIDGILFRPFERPSGSAIAVINGKALGKALQTVHYRYVWNGIKVTQIYAFDAKGKEIDADTLNGEDDVLAA
jgi:hypothetical protein